MCGRFTLANPTAALNAMPWLHDAPPLSPHHNIAPGQQTLMIHGQPQPIARLARWGIVKNWTSRAGNLLINARAQTVLETPTFADSFRHRRCVIPADGFYEWSKTGTTAQPFLFQLTSGAPFCLAGLHEHSGGEMNFVILTTNANATVKHVHARMPVMLSPADALAYLTTSADAPEMRHLFQPFPSERMISHRVSPLVNRVENDSPACMQPYHPQSGQQGDLFRST